MKVKESIRVREERKREKERRWRVNIWQVITPPRPQCVITLKHSRLEALSPIIV